MKRVFLNYSKEVCPNGCLYCFDKWGINSSNYDEIADYKDDVIIYPLCNNDIDVFTNIMLLEEYIERIISLQTHYSIISLSTKSNIPDTFLEWINKTNKLNLGKSLIKLSVAFSCKNDVHTIEPLATTYNERIKLLQKLSILQMPVSIIIKPLLPFVDIEEYYNIIDDARKYTRAVIIGELYVNQDNDFYRDYIQGKYRVSTKKVLWLKNKPLWSVVESQTKLDQIAVYCKKNKIDCYYSDQEFLEALRGQHNGHV
jgi:DNA repair photolyase